MHKFIKTILATTCFALTLTPVFSSDDDAELDLTGPARGQEKESISELLLQLVPTNTRSESTDNLVQIFATGGKTNFSWVSLSKKLTVTLSYTPNGQISEFMSSLPTVENDGLATFISNSLREQFFPEGDYSTCNRTKRARNMIQQTTWLDQLSDPKKTQFFKDNPALFGDDGMQGFIEKNLKGAFTASADFSLSERILDKKLLVKVLESTDPITFTFALPRADGAAKDTKKEKEFGNETRAYVATQLSQGTVSLTFRTTPLDSVAVALGDRTFNNETGLSDIIDQFESEATRTLGLFVTAAALKAGISTSSGMHM